MTGELMARVHETVVVPADRVAVRVKLRNACSTVTAIAPQAERLVERKRPVGLFRPFRDPPQPANDRRGGRPTSAADQLEHDATVLAPSAIAAYLQAQLGQRIAAHLVGLSDTRQLGRYSRADGPAPSQVTERRLREAYKVVRMITEAYDATKAWLFGTNSRLDDEAPVDLLGQATETAQLAAVVRAARQFASFQ
jgi:hypothetical protein